MPFDKSGRWYEKLEKPRVPTAGEKKQQQHDYIMSVLEEARRNPYPVKKEYVNDSKPAQAPSPSPKPTNAPPPAKMPEPQTPARWGQQPVEDWGWRGTPKPGKSSLSPDPGLLKILQRDPVEDFQNKRKESKPIPDMYKGMAGAVDQQRNRQQSYGVGSMNAEIAAAPGGNAYSDLLQQSNQAIKDALDKGDTAALTAAMSKHQQLRSQIGNQYNKVPTISGPQATPAWQKALDSAQKFGKNMDTFGANAVQGFADSVPGVNALSKAITGHDTNKMAKEYAQYLTDLKADPSLGDPMSPEDYFKFDGKMVSASEASDILRRAGVSQGGYGWWGNFSGNVAGNAASLFGGGGGAVAKGVTTLTKQVLKTAPKWLQHQASSIMGAAAAGITYQTQMEIGKELAHPEEASLKEHLQNIGSTGLYYGAYGVAAPWAEKFMNFTGKNMPGPVKNVIGNMEHKAPALTHVAHSATEGLISGGIVGAGQAGWQVATGHPDKAWDSLTGEAKGEMAENFVESIAYSLMRRGGAHPNAIPAKAGISEGHDHVETIVNRVLNKLSDTEKDDYIVAMKGAEAAGIPRDEAHNRILDALAQTEDGQRKIDEAVQEEFDSHVENKVANAAGQSETAPIQQEQTAQQQPEQQPQAEGGTTIWVGNKREVYHTPDDLYARLSGLDETQLRTIADETKITGAKKVDAADLPKFITDSLTRTDFSVPRKAAKDNFEKSLNKIKETVSEPQFNRIQNQLDKFVNGHVDFRVDNVLFDPITDSKGTVALNYTDLKTDQQHTTTIDPQGQIISNSPGYEMKRDFKNTLAEWSWDHNRSVVPESDADWHGWTLQDRTKAKAAEKLRNQIEQAKNANNKPQMSGAEHDSDFHMPAATATQTQAANGNTTVTQPEAKRQPVADPQPGMQVGMAGKGDAQFTVVSVDAKGFVKLRSQQGTELPSVHKGNLFAQSQQAQPAQGAAPSQASDDAVTSPASTATQKEKERHAEYGDYVTLSDREGDFNVIEDRGSTLVVLGNHGGKFKVNRSEVTSAKPGILSKTPINPAQPKVTSWNEHPWAKDVKSSELSMYLDNWQSDESSPPTIIDAVKEAKYVLGTFSESGHANNAALAGDDEANGKEWAKQEMKALREFIGKYEGKYLSQEEINALLGHGPAIPASTEVLQHQFYAVSPNPDDEMEAIRLRKPPNILVSYGTWGDPQRTKMSIKEFIQWLGYQPENVIADNGAFTNFNQGHDSQLYEVMEYFQEQLGLSPAETWHEIQAIMNRDDNTDLPETTSTELNKLRQKHSGNDVLQHLEGVYNRVKSGEKVLPKEEAQAIWGYGEQEHDGKANPAHTKIVQQFISAALKDMKQSAWPDFFKFVEWLGYNNPVIDYVMAPDILTKGKPFDETVAPRDESNLEAGSAKNSVDGEYIQQLANFTFRVLRSAGYKSIPVFQFYSDHKYLDELIADGADYIAIATNSDWSKNMDGKTKADRAEYVRNIVQKYAKSGVKFHLLGTNDPKLIDMIGPGLYSADGTTWQKSMYSVPADQRAETGATDIDKREQQVQDRKDEADKYASLIPDALKSLAAKAQEHGSFYEFKDALMKANSADGQSVWLALEHKINKKFITVKVNGTPYMFPYTAKEKTNNRLGGVGLPKGGGSVSDWQDRTNYMPISQEMGYDYFINMISGEPVETLRVKKHGFKDLEDFYKKAAIWSQFTPGARVSWQQPGRGTQYGSIIDAGDLPMQNGGVPAVAVQEDDDEGKGIRSIKRVDQLTLDAGTRIKYRQDWKYHMRVEWTGKDGVKRTGTTAGMVLITEDDIRVQPDDPSYLGPNKKTEFIKLADLKVIEDKPAGQQPEENVEVTPVSYDRNKTYPFTLKQDQPIQDYAYTELAQEVVDFIIDTTGIQDRLASGNKNEAIAVFKDAINGFRAKGEGIEIGGYYTPGPDKQFTLEIKPEYRLLPYKITNFKELLDHYFHKTSTPEQSVIPTFKYGSTVQVVQEDGSLRDAKYLGQASDSRARVQYDGSENQEFVAHGRVQQDGKASNMLFEGRTVYFDREDGTETSASYMGRTPGTTKVYVKGHDGKMYGVLPEEIRLEPKGTTAPADETTNNNIVDTYDKAMRQIKKLIFKDESLKHLYENNPGQDEKILRDIWNRTATDHILDVAQTLSAHDQNAQMQLIKNYADGTLLDELFTEYMDKQSKNNGTGGKSNESTTNRPNDSAGVEGGKSADVPVGNAVGDGPATPGANGGRAESAGGRNDPEKSPVGRPDSTGGTNGPNNDSGAGDSQEGNAVRPPREPRAKSKPADFVITDELENLGGAKTKFKQNVAAIRLLRELEREDRYPTPEEQTVLSRYVGWGGVAEAFDEREKMQERWGREYNELRGMVEDGTITEQEYEAMLASVLNAHFTSPSVINPMFEALKRLGFKGGRILEPSMGTGNFFGLMPKDMTAKSSRIGVELEPITGGIAKKLYPNASVNVQGFETFQIADGYFDVAIGNVPFGTSGVIDESYNRVITRRIHNYFFIKSLDKVRDGGIVMFITSSGTLNSNENEMLRQEMANRGDFLGAIRLPGNAFKQNAGTEVTTDIIVFQKREAGKPENHAGAFVKTNKTMLRLWDDKKGKMVNTPFDENQWFIDHPELVLGENVPDKLHPDRLGVKADSRNMDEALAEAFKIIPGGIYKERAKGSKEFAEQQEAVLDSTGWRNVDPGAYYLENGKLMQRQGSVGVVAKLAATDTERLTDMIPMRDAVRNLLRDMRNPAFTDEDIADQQKELNRRYDAFVKKHGPINDSKNKNLLKTDPVGGGLLASIESYEREGKGQNAKVTVEKKAIFHKRVLPPLRTTTKADSSEEALVLSFYERGRMDLAYMSELTGKPEDQLISDLGDRVFHNPGTDSWETADEYISGNVRVKLADAQKAAERDPKYQRNVDNLQAEQPVDLESHEIKVKIGSAWIPHMDYEAFINDVLGVKGKVEVRRDPLTSKWKVIEKNKYDWNSGLNKNIRNTQEYGVDGQLTFLEIMQDSLNLTPSTVWTTDAEDKKVPEREKTAEARNIQLQIQETFSDWLWSDPKREERLVQDYNWQFNNTKLRAYDGQLVYGRGKDQHVTIPGLAENIKLHPWQKDAVWRVLQGKNTLLAHVVGAGKTLEMIVSAMEMRRLGMANKPMFVVPKLTYEQMADQIYAAYPGAKVLRLTSDILPSVKTARSKKKPISDAEYQKKQETNRLERARILSQIATGDYDIILISQTVFTRLPVSPERTLEHIRQQIKEVVNAIKGAKDENDATTVKQLENTKRTLEEKLKRNLDEDKKDVVIPFEELGIDSLFVDEAHYYKNLFFHTKMNNVAGLSSSNVKRAEDMYLKTGWLTETRNGGGVVFATGTPISNSMSEMFALQRYLQGEEMRQLGLGHFDSWAAMFGETTTDWEMTASGQFKQRTRFAKFNNIPELLHMFFSFADVKTREMLDMPTPPNVEREVVPVPLSPGQKRYMGELVERAKNMSSADKKVDNFLKLTTDGKMMAVDLRLVKSGEADDPGSKLNTVVREVARVHNDKELAKDKDGNRINNHTQIVFLDLGTPKKDDDKQEEDDEDAGAAPKVKTSAAVEAEEKKFRALYQDIKNKLIKQGIPANEIAFIHDAKTAEEKITLSKKVNEGRIRILLGSSQKAGVGLNIQDKLVALHNVDPTWTPAGIEQREGRIIRQGNKNNRIHIYTYVTQDSFDALMWDLLRVKATFIAQMMSGRIDVRSAEDIGTQALGFAHIAGQAMGNTLVKDKLDADRIVFDLSSEKNRFERNRRNAEGRIARNPEKIKDDEKRIEKYRSDIAVRKDTRGDNFSIILDGVTYDKRKDADTALDELVEAKKVDMKTAKEGSREQIGEIGGGFKIFFRKGHMKGYWHLDLVGPSGTEYYVNDIGIAQLENALYRPEDMIQDRLEEIDTMKQQIEDSKRILEIKFEKADELKAAIKLVTDLERQIEEINMANDNVLSGDSEGSAEASGPDESYKGNTVEERMAYDINAEKEGGVGIVAGVFGSRKRVSSHPKQGLVPRAPAHIEERLQAAENIDKGNAFHRIGELLTKFKNQITREFEHLPKEAKFEPLRQKLLQLLGQKDVAKFKTYRITLQAITQKLTKEEYQLFQRKVIMDDQYEEMTRGGALNFEFTPEELEAHKKEVDAVVAQNRHVKEALKMRAAAWEEIKERYFEVMESVGYNVRNKLTREHYFRRLVIEHAKEQAKNMPSGGGARLKTPSGSGHLQGRSGDYTGDHMANYLVAEGEVLTQLIYDTAKAEVIKFVDEKYNQMRRLKTEAKDANMSAMQAIFQKEKKDPDADVHPKTGEPISATEKFYMKFNQRIAIAFKGFTKLDPNEMWQGEDGEFEDVAFHLATAEEQDPEADGETAPNRKTHPQTFIYLRELAQRSGEEGNMYARTILSNRNDREAFVEQTLGNHFMTTEKLAKKQGLSMWQPLPGSVFFRKNAQEDVNQVVTDMFTLLVNSFGVQQEKLDEWMAQLNKKLGKPVLAMGARRKEFALTPEIAETLDKITDDPKHAAFMAANRWLTLKFKQAVLLSPNSVVKYNLRNMSSDLEKTFAGNPKALRKAYQAMSELAGVYLKESAGTAEMREYINRGGLANLQQITEVGDIDHIKHFKRFYEKDPKSMLLIKPFMAWWRGARTATDMREAVMRYANYLEYLGQMQKNPNGRPDNFGSSKPELVMALEDIRDRAYKLANELLVDYQATSVFGKSLAENGYPFFRWVEGNIKSTTGLFRNAIQDERLASAVGRKILGKMIFRSPYIAYRVTVNTGKLTLGLSVIATLLQLWNYLMWDDEEKKLPEDVRNSLHLIYGVDPVTGKTLYIDRLGFFEDYLGWFGLDNLVSDTRKILDKERTFQETVTQNWHRWANKAFSGVGPQIKALVEVPSGLSLYPDIFNPSANNRWYEPIAAMFSLRKETNEIRKDLEGIPQPSSKVQWANYLWGWLGSGSDPGEAAYYDVRDLVRDFKKKNNLPIGSSKLNDKREALYNYKLALRYGDDLAMEKYYDDYLAAGGKPNGLQSSLKALDPLYGLSDTNRLKFEESLTPRQLELYDRAYVFLDEVLLGTGKSK